MEEALKKEITYAVPVSQEKQGETQVYRNPEFKDELLCKPQSGMLTVQDSFLNAVKQQPKRRFLGTRIPGTKVFKYKTFEEIKILSTQLGSGIVNMNLIPHAQKHEDIELKILGVHAKNREEWSLLDYANVLYGFTTVALYDTLGPDTIGYIVNHSELVTCFCEKSTVETLLKSEPLGQLKNIVCFDQITEEVKKLASEKGIKLISFQDVIESGKNQEQPYVTIDPKDIYAITYTSGTTGNPKGAMISHQNAMAITATGEKTGKIKSTDVYLSYLPMAHVYERIVIFQMMHFGAEICYYSGDYTKLKEDLADVKPTIFASVPRIYNKFYLGIRSKLSEETGLKKCLIDKAVSSKLEKIETTGEYLDGFWDAIVFKKIRELLGGRVRFMGSGSAPISKDCINFMKICMMCPLVEGYGQTESTAGGFSTDMGDTTCGHVGGIAPSLEFKLVDVPEMNYTSKDKNEKGQKFPRGELYLRGSTVFRGYFKDSQKTKEAVDQDGWLHTGDIAGILPNGAVKIIDRKKNIFKLQQGEYVAPEKIENIYSRVPIVEQIFQHGDSLQNYCIVVVFPNEQYFMSIAQKKNLNQNFEELCNNEDMKREVLDQLQGQGKKDGLFGFEQAKRIILISKNFQDLGCMTNTMKLQRYKAKVHFEKQFQEIYSKQES